MQIRINLQIVVFVLIFILKQQIRLYSMLMGFGFMHECAHIIVGLLLGLKIKSLSIMPFGFNIIFKDNIKIKTHHYKKILIAASGPFLNFLIAGILMLVKQTPVIQNIIYINILIGGFNLFPIYPLDGGRILKAILKIRKLNAEEVTYKTSKIIVVIITAISSILILYYKNFIILFVIVYLWIITIRNERDLRIKKKIYEIIDKNYNKQKI